MAGCPDGNDRQQLPAGEKTGGCPCITPRENAGRSTTVALGTNALAGNRPDRDLTLSL